MQRRIHGALLTASDEVRREGFQRIAVELLGFLLPARCRTLLRPPLWEMRLFTLADFYRLGGSNVSDSKFRVFISSPSEGLTNHRERLFKMLERLGVRPIDLLSEGRPPEPRRSILEYCLEQVRSSDAILAIEGPFPGRTSLPEGESYCEKELEEALKLDKPVFLYSVKEPLASVFRKFFPSEEQSRLITRFTTPFSLAAKAVADVGWWLLRNPKVPWQQKARAGLAVFLCWFLSLGAWVTIPAIILAALGSMAMVVSVHNYVAADVDFVLRPIQLDQIASETCAREGLSCIAVTSAKSYSVKTGEFWGYASFDCTAKVVSRPNCGDKGENNYAIGPRTFVKAPESRVPGNPSGNKLCLERPYYNSVVCVLTR